MASVTRAARFTQSIAFQLPLQAVGVACGRASSGQTRSFIHRTLEDLEKAGQVHEAATGTWISRRYTLRKDGMGFSFHWTTIKEGEAATLGVIECSWIPFCRIHATALP